MKINYKKRILEIMKCAYVENDWPDYTKKDNQEVRALGEKLSPESLWSIVYHVDKETKYCSSYLEYIWEDFLDFEGKKEDGNN